MAESLESLQLSDLGRPKVESSSNDSKAAAQELLPLALYICGPEPLGHLPLHHQSKAFLVSNILSNRKGESPKIVWRRKRMAS